jgi:hypothetical protein
LLPTVKYEKKFVTEPGALHQRGGQRGDAEPGRGQP